MDLDHGLDGCDGCVTGETVLLGAHVHCPDCDTPMLAHPWSTCGTCNTGASIVIDMAAAGSCTAKQLAARWAYFGGRCWCCGGEAQATDHVKPLSRGGSNWPANLRPICTPCNSSKRNTWPLAA